MGQASGIITPVVIGWILQATGSFNGALAYISVHGIIVILAYWIIVGKIQRFTLKEERVKEI
jgi:nitrate/nitrite transporter NarK